MRSFSTSAVASSISKLRASVDGLMSVTSSRIQGDDLGSVGRDGELVRVVHTDIPGWIPARPRLQLGAVAELERKVDA